MSPNGHLVKDPPQQELNYQNQKAEDNTYVTIRPGSFVSLAPIRAHNSKTSYQNRARAKQDTQVRDESVGGECSRSRGKFWRLGRMHGEQVLRTLCFALRTSFFVPKLRQFGNNLSANFKTLSTKFQSTQCKDQSTNLTALQRRRLVSHARWTL